MIVCRSCKAQVFFAVNQTTGRRLIVDAEPDGDRGNVSVKDLGDGSHICRVLTNDEAADARQAGEDLYLDHHATCPEAANWRSRSRR